jgi:hypothetical protein
MHVASGAHSVDRNAPTMSHGALAIFLLQASNWETVAAQLGNSARQPA